ncbi:MAG: aminotransferase class I/II-fold pyridoxal phosphate-dependent enzyme [Bacteroidales bacterium]|nr:aminotransferase class I/II-fold pyridoxal phosphate-dependent enzyme [Bacteroidales bacterium]MBR6846889.1 aminotransferase class I/II-fold pyridoxal phosphate-dependent enzyme [Bacteroidales bacterium]
MNPNHRIHLCLAKMSDTGAEQRFIQEAFDANWVAPLGPNVDAFEKSLEDYFNTSNLPHFTSHLNVAALSSCTAAIHVALLLLGVGEGDEVICQSFSFCASSNPVVYCGATPIFVDSDEETWNMSPELLEKAIKDRIVKTGHKPKAIIVVDLYGMPANWDAIEEIAKRYEIPVVEDAANALGSTYKGKPCGTFGDLATLSFNGNKMITTSGGGAIICKDEATKKRAIFLATQAKEPYLHYEHETIGYNYRMSNISAGIGRGQMTVLENHINHHKHVHELYKELLKDVTVQDNPNADFDSNFWLSTILFDKELDTEAFCLKLDKAGIEARPLWKPMHLQPVFKNTPSYVNGISEKLYKTGICLPSGPWVSDEDVKYIVDTIKAAIV